MEIGIFSYVAKLDKYIFWYQLTCTYKIEIREYINGTHWIHSKNKFDLLTSSMKVKN